MRKSVSPFLCAFLAVVCASTFCVDAAEQKPVSASSTFDGGFLPELALDGDGQTRWASRVGSGEEWLQVDFGKNVRIDCLCIRWEAAYAVDYEVQVSKNGKKWKTIRHQTAGAGGDERLDNLNGKGRWLRIVCHKPGAFPLYSIWELSFPGAETSKALGEARARAEAAHLEATADARKRLREDLAASGADEIVFAARPLNSDGHWYANIGYFAQDDGLKTYAKGGGLYKCVVVSGETVPLLEDAEGTVRDPAVSYDGRTIVFSWRKGGTDSFHLYTIACDGTGLAQLTSGIYDDIEPAWLPDGGIVFVSSRCRRWVNCWLTQVAVLHRCDADGKNVVPISANLEHDNTPWPMPDGRVLYTRWEYVDRSQVDYHHLWAMNPDGTEQTVFFGNMHPGGVFIDAKPVPAADSIVFINSPGHGAQEHAGRVALLDPKRGPDNLDSIRNISGEGYRDPWAVSSGVFLAAKGKGIALMNADGVTDTLYALPEGTPLLLHEPRPICVRPTEPALPRRTDYTKNTGRMILVDAYAGRNMAGIARGDIAKLLVLESLPKPINYTGGMDPLTYGGSFTLERILGTVPVEKDGSAYLELPANRALFFVALDANGDSVKRMQSFCSVMPGETLSCAGCHEARTLSGPARDQRSLDALAREPSRIAPIPEIPDVFDFPRDIQPILDAHCVPCHDYERHPSAPDGPRAGGVILAGDHGPMFSHSYVTLTVNRQFADGRDEPKSNLPPRSIGSSASPLMKKIQGAHHGARLSPRETDMVRFWIESGAAYPGTYAALGGGSIGGYYANTLAENDAEWPASKTAAAVFARRCASCHAGERSLPRYLSDENDLSFWRPDWNDPKLKRSRHLVFNLSRPEKSLFLLAPLAPQAGGYGLCRTDGNGAPDVFAETSDADYQALLAMCAAGKQRLETIGRFDMPGFRPPAPYIREMKRYNVLPRDLPNDAPIDVYQTDRAYWRSFDQETARQHPAYLTEIPARSETIAGKGT